MNRLSPKACGLAIGILWGASMLFMGLLSMVSGWAQPFVNALSPLYIGYSATILGCLIGTAWGFIDGFVGGVMFAWLYNKFI